MTVSPTPRRRTDPTKDTLGRVPENTTQATFASMVAEDPRLVRRRAPLAAHGHDLPVRSET